ncbi:hypothetical protein BBK36DRAFT_1138329 [Trichoderma citrinoviride]|uniref:Uncharacterized protein n=1 Tax=Trichoderma citrinoviride TaxID=58853 RepID=A0A2T4BKT7_9HYPO|nr:hypothetical protein BBK36DRAFT_1138329 [Trichoderma citrinoviride]PTB69917.1 hypothetical protein BBK36DRAFT_1138329 [Trichoderma citrinoviride]
MDIEVMMPSLEKAHNSARKQRQRVDIENWSELWITSPKANSILCRSPLRRKLSGHFAPKPAEIVHCVLAIFMSMLLGAMSYQNHHVKGLQGLKASRRPNNALSEVQRPEWLLTAWLFAWNLMAKGKDPALPRLRGKQEMPVPNTW